MQIGAAPYQDVEADRFELKRDTAENGDGETMMTKALDGGCHCGAIRYRVTGAPKLTEFCHCRSCRRSIGSPLAAWAAYTHDRFDLLSGSPKEHQSSETVTRSFCGTCGTSLTLKDRRFPEDIYITIPSLDQAETLPPHFHIWRSQRLPWLETSDNLRRYLCFKSDGLIEE